MHDHCRAMLMLSNIEGGQVSGKRLDTKKQLDCLQEQN